jgi:hypothetical protein
MMSHNGYYCCNVCEIKGDYDSKVIFPHKSVENICLRTKESYFKAIDNIVLNGKTDDSGNFHSCSSFNISTDYQKIFIGIKGETILINHLDIFKDVLFDFMHLCCEGYTRRFLFSLTETKNNKMNFYLGNSST